jgi:hypothetical protein
MLGLFTLGGSIHAEHLIASSKVAVPRGVVDLLSIAGE